jgi:hypothetical protein
MSRHRYIVWIKEEIGGPWVPNGDGPMTERDAVRVARELRESFRIPTRPLPAGVSPNDLQKPKPGLSAR